MRRAFAVLEGRGHSRSGMTALWRAAQARRRYLVACICMRLSHLTHLTHLTLSP